MSQSSQSSSFSRLGQRQRPQCLVYLVENGCFRQSYDHMWMGSLRLGKEDRLLARPSLQEYDAFTVDELTVASSRIREASS